MKKILYCVFAVVFFAYGYISPTDSYAADENASIKKVYLVKVYQKDPWIGNYRLVQLGSAVAVDSNKLVTNAHVILDSDTQEPYQYIEVCETTSIKNPPRCFGAADIINYDTDQDLALLQTSKKLAISKLSSTTPKIKQKIVTIGYPSNGGSTITATQGIIAGYEDEHYKIDANIDHGNSGGGSYNESGELVGIPVFYIDGGTALGYMIPASVVKSFVQTNKNKKASIIADQSFSQSIKHTQTTIAKQTIANPFFTLKLKNSGFTLLSESKDPESGIASYNLKHKDNKSYLTISVSANDNLVFDLPGHQEAMDKVKDEFENIFYQSGTKNSFMREYLKLTKNKQDKKTNMIGYSLNLTNNNQVSFYLITQSANAASEQDFKKLTNNLQPITTTSVTPRQQLQTILLPVNHKSINKHYSMEDYGKRLMTFDVQGKYTNASLDLEAIGDYSVSETKKKNLQSFADSMNDYLEDKVTKQGFVSSNNNTSKRYIIISTCTECDAHNVWAYSFVTNPVDKKVYLLVISFGHSLKGMTDIDTNNILDYISQINIQSTIPYQTDGITRKTFEEFKQ